MLFSNSKQSQNEFNTNNIQNGNNIISCKTSAIVLEITLDKQLHWHDQLTIY